MPCTINPSIQNYVRVNASTPREPTNQPKSAIVRIIAMAINSLVPHVAQDTSAFRNCLLLPTCSASSGVVVGWTALHFGDFAELGCVGLLV
jgi:hypothetical protein